MKKTIIALSVTALLLGIAAVSFAVAPKAVKLVPVTVSVQGFDCQSCPDALQKDLAKLPGVTGVKATLSPAQVTAKLDESKITASAFVTAIATHKQFMDATKTYGAKLVVYVDASMCASSKIMCPACPPEITKVLKSIKGVSAVSLDSTGKVVAITFAKDAKVTTQAIANALAKSSFHFSSSFAAPTAKATQSTMQCTPGMACH